MASVVARAFPGTRRHEASATAAFTAVKYKAPIGVFFDSLVCRRFGVPYARLSSTAPHHSGCDSSAGDNGAHAIVCSFLRAPRTWRHNRVSDVLAYAARKFDFQVYIQWAA